ncbi:MAG TPA: ROK family protein, partial [Candidatus Deferrimicrobium sp.]|nr:ROK family protein [Candidatus Deferrimicrobium sp.]
MVLGRLDVGQRSETAHRANLGAIVRGLHENGPQLRSDLVAATSLTRTAIRSLVGELRGVGLVSEDPPVPQGTPGRPSPLVRVNPRSAAVLAFELLVDSIAAAVVGLGGETLARTRVDRPRRDQSVDEVVADLARLAAQLQPRTDVPVIGIGVAVAGVVRRRDGLVAMAPNLGWLDVPLAARLARALGAAVPISVANEADLGALAEHRRGAAVGIDDLL